MTIVIEVVFQRFLLSFYVVKFFSSGHLNHCPVRNCIMLKLMANQISGLKAVGIFRPVSDRFCSPLLACLGAFLGNWSAQGPDKNAGMLFDESKVFCCG